MLGSARRLALALAIGGAALNTSLDANATSSAPAPDRSAVDRGRGARALKAMQRRVAALTVTLPQRSCAGAIVGNATQVLTAAHCIPEGAETVDVIFGRRRLSAVVALLDRTYDTALLALDEELDVEPLELEAELPRAGERVLFVGRIDRASRAQVARIVRLGRCPSLPAVNDALFTSVNARPGDSGAPLINEDSKVVGLIHGGAACHIATPTAPLAQTLKRLSHRD